MEFWRSYWGLRFDIRGIHTILRGSKVIVVCNDEISCMDCICLTTHPTAPSWFVVELDCPLVYTIASLSISSAHSIYLCSFLKMSSFWFKLLGLLLALRLCVVFRKPFSLTCRPLMMKISMGFPILGLYSLQWTAFC